MNFTDYPNNFTNDETISSRNYAKGASRKLLSFMKSLGDEELARRLRYLQSTIKKLGISFTVYSDAGNIDREWPLDLIPRIIKAQEWSTVCDGLTQRNKALNMFIDDIYNKQNIINDKIIPADLIKSANYISACEGVRPKYGIWSHITGSDLIRDDQRGFLVLEDNLRVPSGVSYMLENRAIMKIIMPELFRRYKIQSVDRYTNDLSDILISISPRQIKKPSIALLTPGIYNSAYFEHAYLAKKIGAELVEGSDLFVEGDYLYKKTLLGPERIDVVYRRIDDHFLDPDILRKDSVLGVPGIMKVWQKGHVAIANAPGSGVADDKVIYTFVPKMIEYYLSEQPIIENVPSYLCYNKQQRDHVLANIAKMVVKPANESGGYGILIGPQASKAELNEFKALIQKNPRNYIAQPLISLSTCPILTDKKLSPRHVDLRPFVLAGKNNYITAGGLTRVATQKGSYVVNSSQGGGSKDTWIVED